MRSRRSLRGAVAALGIVALFVAGSARATPTEASWTEVEYGSGSTVSGGIMSAPTITSCVPKTAVLGLILDSVTITWTSEYGTAAQRVYLAGTLGTSPITSTGPVNGVYTHTTKYSNTGLLASLLTALGGTAAIDVRHVAGENWISPPATRTLKVSLLGLFAPTCT